MKPSHSHEDSTRRVYIFYHYLYPDTVVSALHLDDLCQGLDERGWSVTAFPGNRGCRDETLTYPSLDIHNGVRLRRIWRPRFRQSSSLGRLLNAAWMITAWSLLALRTDPPEAIVVGTDPILSVTISLAWKFFRPRTRILHWCFDLYPEAAYADNLVSPHGMVARFLHALLRHAYAKCDWIVAIGPCMLERLTHYRSSDRGNDKEQRLEENEGAFAIIVPWALQEPAEVLRSDTAERNAVFGDVHLTLLYSGNFGRAHTYDAFLLLAQQLKPESAALAFSVRGNREPELYNAVQAIDAKNACPIRFVPFAAPDRLLARLAAPDVHMLSLAPAWTGTVVPSKFFGALAAGRPVCYSGAPDSSVARWISRYELGWLLTPETVPAVAADLVSYVGDPERVRKMQQRCRDTYQKLFSKRASLDHMHSLLVTGVSASA